MRQRLPRFSIMSGASLEGQTQKPKGSLGGHIGVIRDDLHRHPGSRCPARWVTWQEHPTSAIRGV